AVRMVSAARQGEALPELDRSGAVGSRAPRYNGFELALGDKPYVDDITMPGMLHGAVRFSDHPRARGLQLDTARAEAHPGVVAVVTARMFRAGTLKGTSGPTGRSSPGRAVSRDTSAMSSRRWRPRP